MEYAVVKKTVFVTADNSEYATEAEAKHHNMMLFIAGRLAEACDFDRAEYTNAMEVTGWFLKHFVLLARNPSPAVHKSREEAFSMLGQAIEMASEWRGSKMPEEYEEFDAEINSMKEALIYLSEMIGRVK